MAGDGNMANSEHSLNQSQTLGSPVQMLTEAIQLHQAGNLVNAEHLYRQILTANPQHSDALHLLGVIAYQCGQNAAAVQLIRSAIEINESIAVYHNNLGNVLNTLGQDNDALNSYNYAIKFD